MSPREEKLIRATGLEDYFRCEVQSALEHQKVKTNPFTEFYLVTMLSNFGRSTSLYSGPEEKETPLALLYLESLQVNPHEGFKLLKQLADFALYIAGFFQDSLNRKLVDLDYYIQMGGNAYHQLHSLSRIHSTADAFSETFLELAGNFIRFVDVLSEISENANVSTATDLLRLYEKWLSTGSERLQRKLQELGMPTHLIPKPEVKH